MLDPAGHPVTDAAAGLPVNAAGHGHVGDIGTTTADGDFNHCFAFSGTGTLQIVRGGGRLEGHITVDPGRPTRQRVAPGEVRVQPLAPFPTLGAVRASFSCITATAVSHTYDGPFSRVEWLTPPTGKAVSWSGGGFGACEGDLCVEGTYSRTTAMPGERRRGSRPVTVMRRRLSSLEIHRSEIPRVTGSQVVRFHCQGSAASGRCKPRHPPEDECSDGFCEARALDEIDAAPAGLRVRFGDRGGRPHG